MALTPEREEPAAPVLEELFTAGGRDENTGILWDGQVAPPDEPPPVEGEGPKP